MFFILLVSMSMSFAKFEKLAVESVEMVLPKNIVVQFDAKSTPIDASLVTYISGVGHIPSTLDMVTFERHQNQIKIFKFQFISQSPLANWSQASNEKDRNYPNAEFFYKLEEGILPLTQFNDLLRELSQIHHMNTFIEYKLSPLNPVALNGTQNNKYANTYGGFSSSSADFATIVNLWKDKEAGFLYGFIGYQGSESEKISLKERAMDLVLKKILAVVKWTTVKEISPLHQKIFHHQLSVAQTYYNNDFGWWVKERVLSLAGVFGSQEEISLLLEELNPTTKAGASDPSAQRLKYIAASSLARISKKDFRLNSTNQPLPIEETAKLYKKEFSK